MTRPSPEGAGPTGRERGPGRWFDVERFRTSATRVAEVRRVARPTVVLGSTQSADVLDPAACAGAGVQVVRRRSGGGLVLLGPSDPVWCDLWVPRGDPLWEDDVASSPWWVGDLWATALARLGVPDPVVHRGGMVAGPGSDVVCFAGLGPGEVTAGGRKVVGVAQWRCRQGALFHTAAYRAWEPESLLGLLAPSCPSGPGPSRRADGPRSQGPPDGRHDRQAVPRPSVVGQLEGAAVGINDLVGRDEAPARVVDALVASLPPGPAWHLERP